MIERATLALNARVPALPMAVLLGALLCPVTSARATAYRFGAIALTPPVGATLSQATGYSDAAASGGYAAGFANVPGVGRRPVRWDANGTSTRLGDVPDVTTISSYATGVNDDGIVVGYGLLSGTGGASGDRAIRWDTSGAATRLADLPNVTTNESAAHAIADNGVAAGYANIAGANRRAVRWEANGTPTRLGDLAGINTIGSVAYGVNQTGVAVGSASLSGQSDRALRWNADGTATRLGDLAGQTTVSSIAYAVADDGAAAGYIQLPGVTGNRAVRWTASGAATRLGDLAGAATTRSEAYGVATGGVTAGLAKRNGESGTRAVLWDAAGNAQLVQSLLGPAFAGSTLVEARGLDSDGAFLRMVAVGFDANNVGVLLLLTAPVAGSTYGSGDANLDGNIDFDDLLVVAQHYGRAANGSTTVGDFDLDNDTDFDDLLTLAQHYGQAAALASDWALATSLVPEPTTAIGLSIMALCTRRRRGD